MKAERARIEDEARFGIASPKSWEEAFVAWAEHGVGHISAKTRQRYAVSLDQLRPFLAGISLRDITPDKLREIAKARRKVATIATLKRDLTALSSVLDHAIGEGWIDNNPTLSFRAQRTMRERRDPIVLPQDDAIARMEAAAPSRFADAMRFARLTGMREEEIFGLKHSQISERSETITIVGKRRKMRVIPYSPAARAIVDRQPRHIKQPWVFWQGDGERWKSPASRFGDIRRRVAQKAAQHGVAFIGYRFHDYRHLFAVEYLRDGLGSIYDLQGLLGHDSIRTTEGYLEFLTPDEKFRAMHGVAQGGAQEQRFNTSEGGKNG